MIAYCGISCQECSAFIATMNNNNASREEVALLWSKKYNADLKPEDINCVGCTSRSQKVFSYCKVCEIRQCCISRELPNCAFCDDYACDKLIKFFKMAPDAQKRLDKIRISIQQG